MLSKTRTWQPMVVFFGGFWSFKLTLNVKGETKCLLGTRVKVPRLLRLPKFVLEANKEIEYLYREEKFSTMHYFSFYIRTSLIAVLLGAQLEHAKCLEPKKSIDLP